MVKRKPDISKLHFGPIDWNPNYVNSSYYGAPVPHCTPPQYVVGTTLTQRKLKAVYYVLISIFTVLNLLLLSNSGCSELLKIGRGVCLSIYDV